MAETDTYKIIGEIHAINAFVDAPKFNKILADSEVLIAKVANSDILNLEKSEIINSEITINQLMQYHFGFLKNLIEKSQKFALREIIKTMPKTIYLEGTQIPPEYIPVFKHIDKARYAAIKTAKNLIYLDEGVEAYTEKNYIERSKEREEAWLEKMMSNGAGLVIIGAAHAENIKKGLEKQELEAEIIFNALEENLEEN